MPGELLGVLWPRHFMAPARYGIACLCSGIDGIGYWYHCFHHLLSCSPLSEPIPSAAVFRRHLPRRFAGFGPVFPEGRTTVDPPDNRFLLFLYQCRPTRARLAFR